MGDVFGTLKYFFILAILVVAFVIFLYLLGLFGVGPFAKDPVGLGEPCKMHTDCLDWGPDATDVACCSGKCTRKRRNYAGVGWCPDECVGKFGGKPGTCQPGGKMGKKLGESCKNHTDCRGYGPKVTDNACCGDRKGQNKKCTKKMADYTKLDPGYCPWECKGKSGGKLGTCGDMAKTTLTKLGGKCKNNNDCLGWGPKRGDAACCSGKCKKRILDYAGNAYCPEYCVGWFGAKPGTCGQKAPQHKGKGAAEAGERCVVPTDCKGNGIAPGDFSCCKGRCTRLLKDYLGIVGYCPSVCIGKAGGKPGTCKKS